MKTLTAKVPEELDLKLSAVAARTRESKSALIRAALDHMLKSSEAITPNSCLDLDTTFDMNYIHNYNKY